MVDDEKTPEEETPEEETPETPADDPTPDSVESGSAPQPKDEPPDPSALSKDEPSAEDQDSEDDSSDDEDVAEEAPQRAARSRRGGDGVSTTKESPRRRQREPGEEIIVRAQAKYVRSSARKARLVCEHIRGKNVEEARAILAFTNRAVARDWRKLLESAIANAEDAHGLDPDELKIHAVYADEGPTLKRYQPRAMGRATKIRKRTAHLTIQLTTKEG